MAGKSSANPIDKSTNVVGSGTAAVLPPLASKFSSAWMSRLFTPPLPVQLQFLSLPRSRCSPLAQFRSLSLAA
jgi:hypothetical protein